jgi:hypothetical protein
MADLTLAPDDVEAMRRRLEAPRNALRDWAAQFQAPRGGGAARRGRGAGRGGGGGRRRDEGSDRASTPEPRVYPQHDDDDPVPEEEEAAPPPPAPDAPPPPPRKIRRVLPPAVQIVMQAVGAPDPLEPCFFCVRGELNDPSMAWEPLRQVAVCFQANLSHGDRMQLTTEITNIVNDEIIGEANKNRRPGERMIPRVSKGCVYEHFTRHSLEFGPRRAVRLGWIDELLHGIYNSECWVQEETEPESDVWGPPRPNPSGVRMLREVMALEKTMYGQDPKRAMFSSAGIGLATEDVRPVIDASKRRLHSKNAGRHTGSAPSNHGNSAGVGSTIAGSGIAQQQRR